MGIAMTSRRALLASFLAAPVAVRLGAWVKPAPMLPTADLDLVALMVAEHERNMRAGMVAMMAVYERARIEVTRQFVDAACLSSQVPVHG